jgi:hypothetical protein
VNARVLIDLRGECLAASEADDAPQELSEALRASEAGSVCLLTDWGPGTVFGVATVLAPANTAPAVLEKQLRDQGETDELSHILVHQSLAGVGSTELAYSAVPIKSWRRYQQIAADHPDQLLMHDWVRTLIHWARSRSLADGAALALHRHGLDVVVLKEGRVTAMDRLRPFQDEGDAWEQIGQRAASMLRDFDPLGVALPAGGLPSVKVLVLPGAESTLPVILRGMGPVDQVEIWAANAELVRSELQNTASAVHALDWSGFAESLPLRQAVNRPIEKASAWADRWAPRIGVAALGLSCIVAATAGVMHYKTQIAAASLSGDARKSRTTWESLNTAVKDADQLAARQKGVREWVQKRVEGAQVPDMNLVLSHIRDVLPPGMVIEEVGLVVEKGAHLVTVVGHAGVIEDSLRTESAFAQALQSDGFTLKKRDVLLKDGRPKFKLSMTWSAS